MILNTNNLFIILNKLKLLISYQGLSMILITSCDLVNEKIKEFILNTEYPINISSISKYFLNKVNLVSQYSNKLIKSREDLINNLNLKISMYEIIVVFSKVNNISRNCWSFKMWMKICENYNIDLINECTKNHLSALFGTICDLNHVSSERLKILLLLREINIPYDYIDKFNGIENTEIKNFVDYLFKKND